MAPVGEILLYSWPAITVVLVLWLCERRIDAYREVGKATDKLLDAYRQNNNKAIEHAETVIGSLATRNHEGLTKLCEGFTLQLRHDAASAGTQLTMLLDTLNRRIEASDRTTMALVSCVVASAGKADTAQMLNELAALNPLEQERERPMPETLNPVLDQQ